MDRFVGDISMNKVKESVLRWVAKGMLEVGAS